MSDTSSSTFTCIRVFTLPQDAYLAKSFLESEGITVFLRDELINQVFNFGTNALGGVKMMVPSVEAERARQLLIEGGYADSENA
ncbi:MAG: DUF2007 domain-containing protein [Paludibacteraceae bacterium]|jgi:hypothetical protein|nr:DUF2007 domain-containing protein [Paludibacteraceae bacterium]